MPTQESIVAQIRQALQVSEPALDTSIGSPVRSILDAVGEVIAETTADQYLLNYHYDIDTKSGSDLDAFVQLFGIYRFPAKRATGTITFSRDTFPSATLYFGSGMQISTNAVPPVLFSTIVPASMSTSQNSVTIPIQCAVGGTVGNVAANTITRAVSPNMGITSIMNASGLSGGADVETDDQLRARFKATVFRGLAGTEQMFLGVALDNQSVTQANVVGPVKTYNDQISISSGVGVSSVQDAAYLYSNSWFLTNQSGGLIPRGQYSVSSSYSPNPPAPTIGTPGTGTTIGTGTYYYALVAHSAHGVTELGTTNSITISSAKGSIPISWTSWDSDITSVDVYKLISGTYYKIGSSTATGSLPDTGSLPAGQTPPLNNTTGAPVVTVTSTTTSIPISTITSDGSAITVQLPGTCPFAIGQAVTIAGVSPSGYNLTGAIVSEVGTTSFQIASSLSLSPGSGGTVTGNPAADGIYNFRFDYLSEISRNDPTNDVTNRVDIYANGFTVANPAPSENVVYPATSATPNVNVFNNTGSVTVEGSPTSLNVSLFERLDGTNPVVGNLFIPLSYAPIVSSPQPTVNGYTYGVDFWVVNEVGPWGNSSKSRCGLEWNITNLALTPPSVNTALTVSYNFNTVPSSIQTSVDLWKLVTTDVLVHQVDMLYLDFYMAVVISQGGYTRDGVLSSIETAISNYLTNISFNGVVRASSVLAAVSAVPGVESIRFLNSADSAAVLYNSNHAAPFYNTAVGSGANGHYGIQNLRQNTSTVLEVFSNYDGSVYRAADVFLSDYELATLNNVYIAQMSQANFGSL